MLMKKFFTFLIFGFLSISVVFAEIPEGQVSIFKVLGLTDVTPYNVAGGASYQFLGPASGWGNMANFDLSKYKTLTLNLTYNEGDAGNQVAVRFNVNATADSTFVKLHKITLPETGTNYSAEIDIAQYANEAGEIKLGGLVFYAGASHWSFTYDGTPVAGPINVEYISVSNGEEVVPNSIKIVKSVDLNAKVDVLSITGTVVRKNVNVSEATKGLKPGIYIVGRQKVLVSK